MKPPDSIFDDGGFCVLLDLKTTTEYKSPHNRSEKIIYVSHDQILFRNLFYALRT